MANIMPSVRKANARETASAHAGVHARAQIQTGGSALVDKQPASQEHIQGVVSFLSYHKDLWL